MNFPNYSMKRRHLFIYFSICIGIHYTLFKKDLLTSFIFGCGGSSLRLSLVVSSRGYCFCSVWVSLPWLLLLWSTAPGPWGSVVAAPRPQHWLSTWGPWAQLLHGVSDPPRPGIKPVSSALLGRLLTTRPPEALIIYFKIFLKF